jgi:glycosyltransferase involved in cell wall biosynthesis
VKHYRVAFFDALHWALQQDDIELRVVYGTPNSKHVERRDNVELPESYGRKVPSFWIADRLTYQCALFEIAAADLVITPNENKLLLNPLLMALRAAGLKKVAFWGKGTIAPASLSAPGEWVRYQTANAVDWWFAYTASSARNIREQGVTCGITATGNAIDTTELRNDIAAITPQCLANAKISMGIGGGPVGIFCGNLSANKSIDFLFTAAKLIRDRIPEFSFLIIGNGPEREHVEFVAARERFIHYAGPRIGAEKALLLKMSDVFLLPGAVGLAILDSFAAGLPLLTTDVRGHGPEISYLEHGHSGLITAHAPRAYADAVVGLLRNPSLMARLRAGATESGYQHSIERMVQNFRHGILSCLALQQEPTLPDEVRPASLGDAAQGSLK